MEIDKIKIGQMYLVEPLEEGEEEYIGKAIRFVNLNDDLSDEDDGVEFENGLCVLAELVKEIN